MPRPKLAVWNQRMLSLMDHLLASKIVDTQKEFCESLGFPPSNLRTIRSGENSFQMHHLHAAARKYRVSPDWLFGFSDTMTLGKSKTPMQQLREAVAAVALVLE